jgi:hypothetical protein
MIQDIQTTLVVVIGRKAARKLSLFILLCSFVSCSITGSQNDSFVRYYNYGEVDEIQVKAEDFILKMRIYKQEQDSLEVIVSMKSRFLQANYIPRSCCYTLRPSSNSQDGTTTVYLSGITEMNFEYWDQEIEFDKVGPLNWYERIVKIPKSSSKIVFVVPYLKSLKDIPYDTQTDQVSRIVVFSFSEVRIDFYDPNVTLKIIESP